MKRLPSRQKVNNAGYVLSWQPTTIRLIRSTLICILPLFLYEIFVLSAYYVGWTYSYGHQTTYILLWTQDYIILIDTRPEVIKLFYAQLN